MINRITPYIAVAALIVALFGLFVPAPDTALGTRINSAEAEIDALKEDLAAAVADHEHPSQLAAKADADCARIEAHLEHSNPSAEHIEAAEAALAADQRVIGGTATCDYELKSGPTADELDDTYGVPEAAE